MYIILKHNAFNINVLNINKTKTLLLAAGLPQIEFQYVKERIWLHGAAGLFTTNIMP